MPPTVFGSGESDVVLQVVHKDILASNDGHVFSRTQLHPASPWYQYDTFAETSDVQELMPLHITVVKVAPDPVFPSGGRLVRQRQTNIWLLLPDSMRLIALFPASSNASNGAGGAGSGADGQGGGGQTGKGGGVVQGSGANDADASTTTKKKRRAGADESASQQQDEDAASKQDDADMTLVDERKAEEADQSLTLVDQSFVDQSKTVVEKEQDPSTAMGTTKGKTAAHDAGVTAAAAAAAPPLTAPPHPPAAPLPPLPPATAPSADPKAKQTTVEDAQDETGAFIEGGLGGDHDEEFNPVVRVDPDEDGKTYSRRHCKRVRKMTADGDCAFRAILANLGAAINEENIAGLREQLHAWLSNKANWVYLGGTSPLIWEELLKTLLPPKGWKSRGDARRWWFRSTLAAPLAMLTGQPVAVIDIVQGLKGSFTALPLDASQPRSGDVIALHYDSSSKGAEHYDAAELFKDQPLPPVQSGHWGKKAGEVVESGGHWDWHQKFAFETRELGSDHDLGDICHCLSKRCIVIDLTADDSQAGSSSRRSGSGSGSGSVRIKTERNATPTSAHDPRMSNSVLEGIVPKVVGETLLSSGEEGSDDEVATGKKKKQPGAAAKEQQPADAPAKKKKGQQQQGQASAAGSNV